MSRLPVRWRLTAVFLAAMALILAATGLFLYLRLASSLDQAIDDGLRTRADDVAALVRQSNSGLREGGRGSLAEEDESLTQVLDSRGRVVDTTPQLGDSPMLSRAEAVRASAGPVFFERDHAGVIDDGARLLAAPVDASGRRLIVVVGTETESRHEALSGLIAQLLIGGPIALVLTGLLAYALAAAALRPVEAMRQEAELITGTEPGRRLPLPPARDEVARLGTTLNAMLERLETALARERSFVADASHELRTPLALLKAELDLALRRPRSVEELERAVRSAADEADRLARLAEDLLVLARADQGRLPVRHEAVRPASLFTAVAERFRQRATQAGRELVASAPPELEVQADRLRLEQALGNLVDNALRHGGGTIELRSVQRNGVVELHVLDEGRGFRPEFLERAFQRFARADESRASDGSGLGLAIADVIAKAHGGEATASNRDTGGADVSISLPKRRP
jgi:two-component system OmpR family sensor kinase